MVLPLVLTLICNMNCDVVSPASFDKWTWVGAVYDLPFWLEISIRRDCLICHVKPELAMNPLCPRVFIISIDAELMDISRKKAS